MRPAQRVRHADTGRGAHAAVALQADLKVRLYVGLYVGNLQADNKSSGCVTWSIEVVRPGN
jgi:hypothetical protein